ncbi:MAG: Ig-like domain-containing protein, partial [Butyricicoccus sp.]
MPHPADGVINNYNANIGTISTAELWLTGSKQDGSQRMLLRAEPNYRCKCPRPKPGSEQRTGDQNANNALDPSGYTYEAVPSNRLAGVTTTLFQQDGSGQPTLWDSEAYNQDNPLFTNENGEYAWFVPTGNWQVRFEKDGYETAYSDWLPVPPPQTDVNVAMVSNAAPEIQSVSAYPDSIRIAFSQYMDISTVNPQTITVSMNGAAVEGSVQPVNREAVAEGSETEYASVFAFIPAQEMAGKVTICIKNAVNYAAKPMTAAYYTTKTIVPAPESIVVADTTAVPYQGGTLVKLQVLPAAAGAGQEIRVVSSSPSIALADQQSIMTDAEGNAALFVKGILPGSSELSFTLMGTDITAKTQVTVGGVLKNTGNCAAVSASEESGTVTAGTEITLTTETSDAAIYYTLDKTDPSDLSNPSRTLYTQPIILTESASIVAYAVKSGMNDSPLSAFHYTVPDSTSVSVEAISVDLPNVSVKTGESLTVSATLLPENASNQKVVWSIDNTTVAAITADGLHCTVTGRSAGNATLTATAADGGHMAMIPITVSGSSGGGGGGSSGGGGGSSGSASYTISEPSGTQNGTVSVNPQSASNGDTVTITVMPDPGYILETLIVTDAAGAELTLTRKSSTEYTFVMP